MKLTFTIRPWKYIEFLYLLVAISQLSFFFKSDKKQRRYRLWKKERMKKKTFYTNYRVIFLRPYIELSFFAHKWNHCIQILFDSLWPWPLTFGNEKVDSSSTCHYLFILPTKFERDRLKNKGVIAELIKLVKNKIIIIIIKLRNRTKTERSSDIIGRP